jgi:hypothetical protein
MTPTPKLRFVERIQLDYPGASTGRYVRILQQWWEHTEWNAPGEWRDVPIERE